VNYLLDTHACLALVRDKPYQVRTRFHRALHSGSSVNTSSLAIFDLWTRVAESPRAQKQIMEIFLAGPINVIAFDEQDAVAAAGLRQELKGLDAKLGDLELLVVSQARVRNLALVTAGTKLPEFKGLIWRDWAR
jgi:predicted nucleic acid-binding protein